LVSFPLQVNRALASLSLDKSAEAQLGQFVSLLLEWNQRINLVSRRDEGSIWEGHILHSLIPLTMLEIPRGVALLDLGSGGGLPGIPLAIVRADLEVTLIDSIQKKMKAVQDIVGRLNLPNVRVAAGRAEELGREAGFAASFDAVIARAVAPLSDLCKWSKPFLRTAGVPATILRKPLQNAKSHYSFPYLLSMKGGDLEKEIRETRLRFQRATITELNLVIPGAENFPLADKKLVLVENL
jgi:16S rRNA (guanine527-N7)-methyltransferase